MTEPTIREHGRLYQHVHLDHGYAHGRHWPVAWHDLERAHEHEHRVGHNRWCDPHLLSEIPVRTLAVVIAVEMGCPIATVMS